MCVCMCVSVYVCVCVWMREMCLSVLGVSQKERKKERERKMLTKLLRQMVHLHDSKLESLSHLEFLLADLRPNLDCAFG